MGVKEAIAELCKLFKALDSSLIITSEDFRLAKINSSNSLERMKDALKVILLKTKFLYNKNTEEIHDLKTAVKNTKYPRVNQLFVDSKIISNRELLFCIAYLLSTFQLWRKNILKFCYEPVDPFGVLLHSHKNMARETSLPKSESVFCQKKEDQVIQICNVIKKLELMHNRLLATKTERCSLDLKINSKVFENCKRFDVCPSSEFNCTHLLLLSKNSDLIQKVLNRIKRKVQVLKSYVKWKENENYFWDWVTCSLREQQNNDNSNVPCDECLRLTQVNSSQSVLKTMHENFKQLVSDLKESQEVFQETLISKGKSLGLDEKQKVKLEIDKLFSSISCTKSEPTITVLDSKIGQSSLNQKPLIESCDYNQILSSVLDDLTYQNQQNRLNNLNKLQKIFEASSLSNFSKLISVKNVVNN